MEETTDLTGEANNAVKELLPFVKDVMLCGKLKPTKDTVYLNLTTKESKDYCVKITLQGYQIAAEEYDKDNSPQNSKIYESVYEMISNISPIYVQTFADSLAAKLQSVADKQKE